MSSTTLKICAASSLFCVAKLALLAVKQVFICLWNTYQGAVLHFQAVLCLKFPLCPNKVSHSANTPPRSSVLMSEGNMKAILLFCGDAWTGFPGGVLCPTAGKYSYREVHCGIRDLYALDCHLLGVALCCGVVPVPPALAPSRAVDSSSVDWTSHVQKRLIFALLEDYLIGNF